MEKLIITCCTNDPIPWKNTRGLNMPVTAKQIADSAHEAYNAGAAVVHVNEPLTDLSKDTMGYNMEAWLEVSRLIRQKTPEVIYEHGQDGIPYMPCEHRIPPAPPAVKNKVFDIAAEKPDMISVMLTNVDYECGTGYHYMPMRDDIVKLLKECYKNGVKPSFEAWHTGTYYEHNWLVEENLIEPPFWYTLYFGSNSGSGSWATTAELNNRISLIPEKCIWQISVHCGVKGLATTEDQMALIIQTIMLGGHVQVGMSDNPYYLDGVPAKSNAQLVERIVNLAKDLGREVATPAEARRIIGIPAQKK